MEIAVFFCVYLGMIFGGIPGLALDRTGVALLGAIVLLASGRLTLPQAAGAVHLPTLALLFGLMVIAAQLRLGGFYTALTRRLVAAPLSPRTLLAVVVFSAGVLAALLANDIVCLVAAPILVDVTTRRRLDPVPFLLALACASNVGSAATLIGNPQNMLIGQTLHLSFTGYMADAAVPALVGLGLVWSIVCFLYRGRWERSQPVPELEFAGFDSWRTGKGLVVLGAVVLAFLFSPWPREIVALCGAGVLLLSRHTATRVKLGAIDWQLLLLFIGLFVVNRALAQTGATEGALRDLAGAGVDLKRPVWLFPSAAVLSNLVSSVPAVILLLPAASGPHAGPVLALASTLAGNLLLVGSIANLIVAEQASRLGIRVTWRTHARVGVPVTLCTLGFAAAWLWLRF